MRKKENDEKKRIKNTHKFESFCIVGFDFELKKI